MNRSDVETQLGRHHGLVVNIGPFSACVQSNIENVVQGVARLYADYPMRAHDGAFVDFHVQLKSPPGIRRWYRPQVNFYFDGRRPFKPLSLDQGFAMFEWGLNWCITYHAHHFLVIHAAVVEKNGTALIMPGAPGAGKSTLCAGLVCRGWRLLSDELTLIPVDGGGSIVPVPRPVSLKNDSIPVIKGFQPSAVFGTVAYDTAKGTVSHMKPPTDSILRSQETARPGLVIFPRYQAAAESVLTPRARAASFMEIARQSFNYNELGRTGFSLLTDLIATADCYDFRYSSLDEAVTIMDGLVSLDNEVQAHA